MENVLAYKSIRVLACGLRFPEGPAFSADGTLWAVELKGGALVQIKGGVIIRYQVGGAPNGIAVDSKGKLWYCDAGENAVKTFDPASGEVQTIVDKIDEERLAAPNDLAFDKQGNLIFTCPGNSRLEPTGYVCVLIKNGQLKKITSGKYFPNGLAFTADGNNLVMAETYKHRLWKGAWNAETAEWNEQKVWCNTGGPAGPGGPDGMAFDCNGYLFVAVYGTGEVRVVNDKGEVVRQLQLPGLNPTNCTFSVTGSLLVTETERGELLEIQL